MAADWRPGVSFGVTVADEHHLPTRLRSLLAIDNPECSIAGELPADGPATAQAGATSYLGAASGARLPDRETRELYRQSADLIILRVVQDTVDASNMDPMFRELGPREICEPLTQSADKLKTTMLARRKRWARPASSMA